MGSGWVFKSFDRARWDAIFGSGDPEGAQKIADAMLWDDDGYFDPDSAELRPGYNRDKILASAKGRAARELASHLVSKGFTYEGLGEAQSVQLDKFGCYMWSPECLDEVLDAKQLSDSWLGIGEVGELLFRAGHVPSLRYLKGPLSTRLPLSTRPSMLGLIASYVWNSRTMTRPSSLSQTPVRLLRLLETGRRFGTEAERTRGDGYHYVVFSPPELVELRHEVEAAINAPIPWTEPKWQPESIERQLLVPINETTKAGRWAAMGWAQ